MVKEQHTPTPAGSAVTRLILETFHFNGMLLAAGDGLAKEFGLTSSLWQVLGAVAYGGPARKTVAQIARQMGLTRQSVQRSAGILERKGLITFEANPDHKRARLVAPTPKGLETLEAVMAVQTDWTNRIAQGEDAGAIDAAVELMRRLSDRL